MTALKLFTTTMNITLLPSLFKAGALTALACGTLALTSVSLSSCGGGGSSSANTPDLAAANLFKGRTYTLPTSPSPGVQLNFGSQQYRNSPVLLGTSQWSNQGSYDTYYTFSDSTVNDGGCTTTVTLGGMSPSVLNDSGFMIFLGFSDASSVTPEKLAFKVVMNADGTAQFTLQTTTAVVSGGVAEAPDATINEKGPFRANPS